MTYTDDFASDAGSRQTGTKTQLVMEDRNFRVALACAAVAVALCSVGVGFSLHQQDWNVTALVRMDDEDAIAPLALLYHSDFAFVPEGHYDGVYFWAMAIDPIARDEAHTLIDHPAYRYGHVGYSWLAWFLSLGREQVVPLSLLFLALVGAGMAGYSASRISSHLGWTPYGGLAVALQPGLVYSVTVLTSEAVGFAVAGLALLYWLEGRTWPTLGFMAFAGIVKEPFVLLPVALFLWALFRQRENLMSKAVLLGLTLVPALFWQLYIYKTFDISSFKDTASPIDFPFGWVDAMNEAAHMGLEAYERTQIGTIALPILVIAFALVFVGIIKALRFRSILDPVFLLQAGVVIALSPAALTYPKDFARTAVFALALVVPAAFTDRAIRRGDPPS